MEDESFSEDPESLPDHVDEPQEESKTKVDDDSDDSKMDLEANMKLQID